MAAQSDRLDLDIRRYSEVFKKRTVGHLTPLEIEHCLGGHTRYLSVSQAREAGIVNGNAASLKIPEGAVWRNVC
ncbi:hypothetical protein C4J81_02795 [Deltaproteobacteria bacterium Smac51]|nr:hypothetical protein C4J81_02790 [Deltaproteobacteria bacterium Smac51]UQZ88195.1 hypothetical protein C4J81_02795 [Deltaproteobacteria bacterium Smac51]